jgi:hypothetical protein
VVHSGGWRLEARKSRWRLGAWPAVLVAALRVRALRAKQGRAEGMKRNWEELGHRTTRGGRSRALGIDTCPWWGHGTGMVATPLATRRRFRNFIEYMACVFEPSLGTIFGPARVRIWSWAKYKVRSTHDDLHLWLSGHSH